MSGRVVLYATKADGSITPVLADAGGNVDVTGGSGGTVSVSNFPAIQPVSATSLPLPTGAAADATLGTIGTTPPTLPGSATGILGMLRYISNLFGSVGSGTAATAGRVVIASDQAAIPVTIASDTAALNIVFPTTQIVSANALPLPTGAATSVSQASLVTTSLGTAGRMVLVDPTTGNGSLVQAFHNSDNQAVGATSYGLFTGGVDQIVNGAGNLDRKRGVSGDGMSITGLAAEVPMLWNGSTFDRAVNGVGTAAKSARVVVATDQTAIPTYRAGTVYTSRSSTITTGGTAQTLMASNAARKGFRVMNLSTVDLWINDEGATAVAGQPSFKVSAGALYESPAFGASTAAISIFGAATAQAFQASEA